VIVGFAFGAWYAYFQAMIFARHGIVFQCNANGWPVLRRDYCLLSPTIAGTTTVAHRPAQVPIHTRCAQYANESLTPARSGIKGAAERI
jgi:hypothetical protein